MQSSTSRHVAGAFKRLRARRTAIHRCVYSTTPSTQSQTSSEASEASSSTATSTTPSSIRAAMVVHRAPLLTPSPTPFESAYYQYSSSIHLALSNPPPTEFYFKKGSLTERRFTRAQWEREAAAFGQRLAGKQPDVGDIPGEEVLSLNHREEGEQGGDNTRLERRGDRSLYLVVKEKGKENWSLPSGRLEKAENLHEAASRNLRETLGLDMDIWLVTRQPIGMLKSSADTTFIFKSHILAGQAVPQSSSSIESFAWLTKEEIKDLFTGQKETVQQWQQIEAVFSD